MEDRYSLPPEIAAALDRARLQVEALAQTADELQIVLPDAVGSALRDGLREEAAPISRRLAEVKGLSNQMIRRLERLETDLLIERHARVDDLAAPRRPDHGASGRALNERLDQIEQRDRPAAPTSSRSARPKPPARPASRGQTSSSKRDPRPTSDSRPIWPAERVRQLARDRQPAGPVPPASRHERPEQPLAILGRDPGPRVLDRDPHRAVRLAELEPDPPAVGRRPERVREQVVDDLQHTVAVGDDHRLRASCRR